MSLLLLYLISLFIVVNSTRNLRTYSKSIISAKTEKLFQRDLSSEEQSPLSSQCSDGESQASNSTILFNFRGRPEDLTNDDVMKLRDAFLSAYEELGSSSCFEVVDLSIDTSEETEEKGRRTRALQSGGAPTLTFNFSLFFFIIFRCYFCPNGSSLLTNDASRRRLQRVFLKKIDEESISLNYGKNDNSLSRRKTYGGQIRSAPNKYNSQKVTSDNKNRILQQQQQQNGDGCSISGNGQQQQQQSSGCNGNSNSQQQQQQHQQQQQQQQNGGSGSTSSNGKQQQGQHQQDGNSISGSINGDQQQQQKQCSANRLENCKGPERDEFRGRYNEVFQDQGDSPQAIDDIIDAVELQWYPCNPSQNRIETSVVVTFRGDYSYLLHGGTNEKNQREIKVIERALKKTYNTLNAANRETCDLQFRHLKKFRFVEATQISNNSFSMTFDVKYKCRGCVFVEGLFHNIGIDDNEQERQVFNVDFQEKGPIEPPCTCAIGASLYRAPTPQEFTKTLQDMINVRKGQGKLAFITGVDNEDSTSEATPVAATHMPATPAPTAAPFSTPQCNSSGCCSQNFASCVSWCGTLSSERECHECNQDLHWICGEQQNCKRRWDDCTSDNSGCCDGLTCVNVNPFHSQCRYVEGQP